MKQIGLFAGIGGFELAARWVGWETIAVSEIDPFCQKVLQYHFPGAQLHGDIKTTDFTEYRGQCDIITGGFPCQPFSAAGKRRGTADERYLWPEMLRVIDEVKPRWVVGENVRGLVNWDGGLVFDTVCTELENIGYEVQPFIIPACGVNAPHRRDRIWFIANATSNDCRNKGPENSEWAEHTTERGKVWSEFTRIGSNGNVTDAIGKRCERGEWLCNEPGKKQGVPIEFSAFCENKKNVFDASSVGRDALNNEHGNTEQGQSGREFGATNSPRNIIFRDTDGIVQSKGGKIQSGDQGAQPSGIRGPNTWDGFPTQSPVCGGNDGIPDGLDGITFSKWRKESIKGYGNAIVPQVAYEIYKAIMLYEQIGANNE